MYSVCKQTAPRRRAFSLPTRPFIDGDTLLSQEGTTQGDPLAMAIAITPLIRRLEDKEIKQVWYADDGTAGGSLTNLVGPYSRDRTSLWLLSECFLNMAGCEGGKS